MNEALKLLFFIIMGVGGLLLIQFIIGLGLLWSKFISKEVFKIVNCSWVISSVFAIIVIYIISYIMFIIMGIE